MPHLFGERTPKRLLSDGTSSLVYGTRCHWLTIALFGPKRVLCYFDPPGNAWPRRDQVQLHKIPLDKPLSEHEYLALPGLWAPL